MNFKLRLKFMALLNATGVAEESILRQPLFCGIEPSMFS